MIGRPVPTQVGQVVPIESQTDAEGVVHLEPGDYVACGACFTPKEPGVPCPNPECEGSAPPAA